MDIVVANGFAMERCTFFSREYHCCVLHNTRCKCEDYNPRNSKPLTHYDRLRAMSVEELADWLAEVLFHCSNTICDERCPMYKCCCDQPSDNIEDWLKQEVSDG